MSLKNNVYGSSEFEKKKKLTPRIEREREMKKNIKKITVGTITYSVIIFIRRFDRTRL